MRGIWRSGRGKDLSFDVRGSMFEVRLFTVVGWLIQLSVDWVEEPSPGTLSFRRSSIRFFSGNNRTRLRNLKRLEKLRECSRRGAGGG